MSVRRRTLEKCMVNPVLIDALAELVGSQVEVMVRAGISWNTWTKIRSAEPITLSVGRRLRSRMVANQHAVEVLGRKVEGANCDPDSLERIFLLPMGEQSRDHMRTLPDQRRHSSANLSSQADVGMA